MTKKKTHPDTLGYNREIGKKIREMSPFHSVKEIHSAIQCFSDAPGSFSTLYKYYRKDIEEPRQSFVTKIGGKVVEQALDGDFKSQELYLRTKGGWTTKDVVETRELGSEMEENEGAVKALMVALGKTTDE